MPQMPVSAYMPLCDIIYSLAGARASFAALHFSIFADTAKPPDAGAPQQRVRPNNRPVEAFLTPFSSQKAFRAQATCKRRSSAEAFLAVLSRCDDTSHAPHERQPRFLATPDHFLEPRASRDIARQDTLDIISATTAQYFRLSLTPSPRHAHATITHAGSGYRRRRALDIVTPATSTPAA